MKWLKSRIPDSSKLYDVVGKHNPVIDTPNTMAALQKLEQGLMNATQAEKNTGSYQTRLKYVQDLLEEMRGTAAPGLSPTQYQKPALGFQKLWGQLKSLNQKYGTDDGELKHIYGTIKGGIQADLDAAAARPLNQTTPTAAAALKAANAAYRKELAYKELQDVMQGVVGAGRSNDMATSFNRGKMLKALRDNPTITKNLSKDELASMTQRFKDMGYIPALPPPSGVQHGAGRIGIEAAIGRLFGLMTGGNPDLDMSLAVASMEGMRKLAETPMGKKLIISATTAQGTPEGARALAVISSMVMGGAQKPDIQTSANQAREKLQGMLR